MRYIVGIDLGTTNSSLTYIDTNKTPLFLQVFSIPQLGAPNKIEYLPILPSFCYLTASGEYPEGALALPWKKNVTTIVGQYAKLQGARVPTRLIQSAKSWLCHVGANRRDKILPLHAEDITQRLSPVEASAKYLEHLCAAWNATIAKGDLESELEEQEVILTVPASFDEVARQLTVEAASLAGLRHVTLLEEPQAAFYSWIAEHENTWTQYFKAKDTILVCDVGGGTTDFSLITLQEKDHSLSFQRMAVGDHLLLGGDNIDIALAHFIEERFPIPLETTQWLQLQAEARVAKEYLLGKKGETYTVVLQGTGSAVVKGSLAVTINQAEVEEFLMNGFFKMYDWPQALQMRKSRGIRTMGLPYEDEPSIIKHLAYFLDQAKQEVDYILFNGGTFKPTIFQEACLQALRRWFPHKDIQELSSVSLDLAVSRGAVYYGKVRRGLGIAIKGGSPRSYYLEVDVKTVTVEKRALTLLPRGSEEGFSFQATQPFFIRPNQPVSFQLLTSHTRLEDQTGDLIGLEDLAKLPPIQTILRFGTADTKESIPVKLGIQLTPVGTLELWLEAVHTSHRWNLEFQVRSATGQDNQVLTIQERQRDETFDQSLIQEAQTLIQDVYKGLIKPQQIIEKLERVLQLKKQLWPPSVLRNLADILIQQATRRIASNELETRWWNLIGFCLRPGCGFPLDDFRIKEIWKIILSDLKSHKGLDVLIQMWICYRRISAGLTKGQQTQLANEIMHVLFIKNKTKIEIKHKSEHYAYTEKIRAIASLERIEIPLKIRVGEALVERLHKDEAFAADYWSLARLGARHLLYASAGQVIPASTCEKWLTQLIQKPFSNDLKVVIEQLAKKTEQRELNVSEACMERVLQWGKEDEEWCNNLQKIHFLTKDEQEYLFGESLPTGLVLTA